MAQPSRTGARQDPPTSSSDRMQVPPSPWRDAVTRALFTGASLAGSAVHASVARAYFGWIHRRPDAWGYLAHRYEHERHAYLMDVIRHEPAATVLELGCAEGVVTRQLGIMPGVKRVVAMDLARAALARAETRCCDIPAIRFVSGDVFGALPEGPFDLVLCAELLYYAGSRGAALATNSAARLAPEGRLILMHPLPQARALHAPFTRHSGLRLAEEHVRQHPTRPYAVAVYRRAS
jgi:SAM-dependent methyltransferase